MSGLVCVTTPAAEPVSLADAKAHLRLDTDDEAGLLSLLIAGAREVAETVTERALVTQTWRMSLDSWCERDGWRERVEPCLAPVAGRVSGRIAVELPKPPLVSVGSVTTYDEAGVGTLWEPAAYFVDRTGAPGRIVRLRGAPWPVPGRAAGGIEIVFTAGYGGPEAVPAALRQAILLLVAHWFENREPTPPRTIGAPIPASVYGLLAPFRVMGL
jgi:uncharacterized phiE125 gp8 family phage protein